MINKITKLLVANRGEIAIRIFKTCKEMGISTVAVFSDADENSLFVKYADEAVRIGGKQPNESYLLIDKIIDAAKQTGANAIHPGYGFLSEKENFAQRCIDENIIWVGPNPNAIEKMGSKIGAKTIMQANNVPTIPGYQGEDQSEATIKAKAIEIGFPVLLKASAGGGGKGMRIVRQEKELDKAINEAKSEAMNAFGDSTLLIEKYFDTSRHVEFQIFGDKHGNAIHLFERECSIQRRYQKVVEESPSPFITEDTRKKMGAAAILACRAIQYDNAGTVEFIVAPDQSFYFLEVNTRLQVEHPITEEVTGLDLVRMQIEVAEGQALQVKQEALQQIGHAIEVRLYAEDPANNFLPVSGKIIDWIPSETDGLRYDTGIESGSEISTFYDPMIAKIIAKGNNRQEAINKLNLALKNTVVTGFTTNKNFLSAILENQDFKAGNFNTHFLDKVFNYSGENYPQTTLDILTCALQHYRFLKRNDKRSIAKGVPAGWRNNFYQAQNEKYAYQGFDFIVEYVNKNEYLEISFADKTFISKFISNHDKVYIFEMNNIRRAFYFSHNGNQYFINAPQLGQIQLNIVDRFPLPIEEVVKGGYIAPMPGEVTNVLVKTGDIVKAGDALLKMISMKMENTIEAHTDGEIEEIYVTDKQFVESGTLLLKMKA
ncbi:MAG TPA: acetyl-CoA carboxylase biotin carboxylase subunit [Chitinophagales bacterium]|nr:acetyl-CoA carboxylase biotin carboxylase subunit [Chitinophagales bacterium]HMU97758.1 acetyl-CoA carboxylase biotin carboxylase subunit [Chitinophagales bacterium]HMV02198.1 acetyl-CoA carboxylase biotin carboxylase subunit [Chitinophagales bacterium]HMW94871.1 acetyl-CoA carboxylase biotin carboxylase subunit [Chitinophagales bacterium]HMY41896.1 acetyl-CoA carboxylase biotin carboxylase subunit [Chitinophagales bacterium]